MRVAILHDEVAADARADELDVLVQAEGIERALAELGHESTRVALGLNLAAAADALRRVGPDLVFNLVESVAGQGRLIHLGPALLDSLGLLYTGAPTDAMYVTSNKLLGKALLRGAGIPTAPWFTGDSSGDASDFQPGRYIIKSVWEHASVGLGDDAVGAFDTLESLRAEIRRRAPKLGHSAFAEPYIDGREFNIALLTRGPEGPPQVLPHAEILFEGYAPDRPRVVDYRAKWDEASYEYHHTPRRFDFPESDRSLLAMLSDICLKCWRAVGLRGYARVDFRVDPSGKPFVLEINTNPCLSPDAGFAAALERGGISTTQAVERILDGTVSASCALSD